MILDKCVLHFRFVNHHGDPFFCQYRFFKTLGSEEERAWYGPDHVELAEQRGAIGSLLISDELFR